MRIAIIGSSGHVGTQLAVYLERHLPGAEIIRTTRKQGRGERYTVFDPLHDDWSALGRLDVLINSAGIIQESKNSDFEVVHVELVRKIIENRSVCGDPRIIQISALGAAEDHPTVFLRTKGIGDAIILKQKNTVVLRPSIICLPDTLLVQKFRMLFSLSKFFFNRALLPTQFMDTQIQPVMPEDLNACIIKLCSSEGESRVIEVVGDDKISFRWLLERASESMNRKLFPVEIPKSLVEAVTRNFITVWFPGLINYDQFQLLFKDNVADTTDVETIIGRKVLSTLEFWNQVFREGSH